MTKKAGKKAGIFCSGGKGSAIRRDEGFDLVVPTAELYILKKQLHRKLLITTKLKSDFERLIKIACLILLNLLINQSYL